ncbi:iron-containing alcohol dehydrogenase family protein [Ectobacillus polymachus]|uniref:iron-containing alcohol dehydrogenase family protein n=1 Tax=Ectobacillus polymachus TaxID=1508806 RepID=UPI003A8C24C0
MKEHLEVRGAPQLYVCEEGVLESLEGRLLNRGIISCLIIHGDASWKAAEPYFPTFSQVLCKFEVYGGECTVEEVARISRKVRKDAFQAVIGVGGGKVLDLVKAIGNETHTATVLIPTLASNCAAWTPLSVFYDKTSIFTHYTVFPTSTNMVLVDPRIILSSPVRLLKAGIADTLAKWYEANVLIEQLFDTPISVTIAHHVAKMCRDVPLQLGEKALASMDIKMISPAFIKVIETIIAAGGMVGGYGDHFGRVAGAHAIHNGLTKMNETHSFLHGEKVAYGIFVQLAIEKKWDEIEFLLPYYKKFHFPSSLADFGIAIGDKEAIQTIAQAAVLPHESIHLIGSVTSKTVVKAMETLEIFITKHSK